MTVRQSSWVVASAFVVASVGCKSRSFSESGTSAVVPSEEKSEQYLTIEKAID